MSHPSLHVPWCQWSVTLSDERFVGFLADGTPGASGAGGLGSVCSDQTAVHFVLILTKRSFPSSKAGVPVPSAFYQTLQHPFHISCAGKTGLPHLTRCHVLVVCNYARRLNFLLSFLFFSCGMDKC